MKTIVLVSAALAVIASASVPASAQFAITSDMMFGHDYSSERAERQARDDLSTGYFDDAAPQTTGSIRAVATDRTSTDTARKAEKPEQPPATGEVPR